LCAILWTIVHQGHADDIAALVRQTMERWPDRGSPRAAQAVAALATAEYVTGRPARAIELAEETLGELEVESLPSVTLRRVLGQARRALGDVDGALAAFREGAAVGHGLGMTAMALELEIAESQVLADAGLVDDAVAMLGDIVKRAVAADSAITEVWGNATLGWVQLRVDVPAALALIETTLAHARDVDFPIGIAVCLRSGAFAHLLRNDLPAALESVRELYTDLLNRGALSNARVLVDVAAAVAYRAGHSGWEALAATARALPVSTMASARFELIPLPATAVAPLPRHQVITFVKSVLADLSEAPSSTGAIPRVEAAARSAVMVEQGDTWLVTFAGTTVTVRNSKGMHDLARLIDAGGREIHCLDLLDAVVDQPSTGEVIDARARSEIEQRIRELQADIDDAERDNDLARADRAQAEFDALVEHLAAALGRGGRRRHGAGTAERARSAVTHRLRSTIRQIDKIHPSVGRHLAASVKTGTYCSYQPEHPTHWRRR
jgi:hypothetical protein